jgi:hypothetical protein
MSVLQCLFPETFPQRWTDDYLDAWKKEACPSPDDIVFLEETSRSPRSLFFAAYDERLLGHAACKDQNDSDEVLCQLRVLPSLANRGVETLLLSNLFDLAAFKHWTHLLVPYSPTTFPTPDFFLNSGGLAIDGGKTILLSPPVRASRIDTVGSFVDELVVTNIQMWHVQECLYEPESLNALSKSEMLHLLHRGTWLNLVRNRCIDNLDAALGRILLPSPSENAGADAITLSELLEHARASLVEFMTTT